ncbi:MAG: response regulator transcription factor [Gammaproteobacteria bacterium]
MKTILLVEDDRKLTLAVGVRLKSMGYEVVTALDAVSAVAQARKNSPDIVLLDINLPGGDGFVVANRLQSLMQTSATPIIFITASKQYGLKERAMEMGASAFLEKPFDATQLADAIESALHSAMPFGSENVSAPDLV